MDANDMVQIPREVLEKLQWVGVDGYKECAFCTGDLVVGHKADCPIGIALKPKDVASKTTNEPVQHEMTYNGEKYRTECIDYVVPELCMFCDFIESCCNSDAPSNSVWCQSRRNADGKNRIWKKVTK